MSTFYEVAGIVEEKGKEGTPKAEAACRLFAWAYG